MRARESCSCYSYITGDYTRLIYIFQACDWSMVLNDNCVDTATENFPLIVRNGTGIFIYRHIIKSSTHLTWVSKELRYYRREEVQLRKFRNRQVRFYGTQSLKLKESS